MPEIDNRPSTLEDDQRHRRRKFLIFCGVLLAFIPLGWGAKELYMQAKGWRVRQLAREAEQFIAEEKWEEAGAKARAAYQLKIDEPNAIRTMAHLQRGVGRPGEALGFWKQLGNYTTLTAEDRRDRIEDYLRAGAINEAEQENNALLAEHPTPETLRVAARLAMGRGKPEQAHEFAHRALEADPKDLDSRLLAAMLQVQDNQPATREKGMHALLDIGKDQGKAGLAALLALAGRKDLPPELATALIPLLRSHPRATDAQRLVALDLEIIAQPAQRDAIIDRTMAEYRGADVGKVRALAVWLNAHGEWNRTLEVIPLEQAHSRKDLLLVHLDAMSALKRWPQIQAILEDRNAPLDEVYKEIFLARSAQEQGRATEAGLHWSRAHSAAASSVEQMIYVARYAETVGRLEEAERAYSSLKQDARSSRPAYEALIRLAERARDTDKLRILLLEMRTRWPQDVAVTNDYAYLSLLLKLDVANCRQLAEQLVEQTPSSLPHRTTLALARLRTNDPAGALKVYEALDINWSEASPAAQAIYAAVLAINGKLDEAQAHLAGLRPALLRPEERDLIKPWLKS